MDISVTEILLGLLLLLVPIGAIRYFEIPMLSRLFSSVARMIGFTAVAGGLMYLALRIDNMLVTIVAAVIFIMISAVMAVWRARLHFAMYIMPIFVGLLTAVVLTGVYMLLLTVGASSLSCARYLIPMTAILSASSVTACGDALTVYYAGLRHHNQLYYYLIGNGATHAEALHYLMRRAIQKSLLPGMTRMSGMVIMAAPVVMWMMVMAGFDVFAAAAFQIMLIVAIVSASTLAVLVALWMAGRYVTDGYGRLKTK